MENASPRPVKLTRIGSASNRGRTPSKKTKPNGWGNQILPILSGLVIWEIISRLTPAMMPSPVEVLTAWSSMIVSGRLWSGIFVSLRSLLVGFPLALGSGILLGMIFGRFKKIGDTLDPFINALMVTPTIALIPILMIWFGMGFSSRVAVVFLFAFFVILVNTTAGVRRVPDLLLQMVRSFGGTERQTFTLIILRASTPSIMTGVRLGAGRAVKGMITAEMLMTLTGMGGLISAYGSQFAINYVFALVFTIILIAIVLMNLVERVDKLVNHWQKTEQSESGI